MAPSTELTEQDILTALAAAPHGSSARELARALRLHGRQRKHLPKILSRLKHQRKITEVTSGRYAVASVAVGKPLAPAAPSQPPGKSAQRADPNVVTGRIVVHRDGYGFVVPDAPLPGVAGDLFVPPGSTGDAMHGDSVAARVEKRRPDGRAEGRVLRIVRRAHPTVVGVFRYDHRGNFVEPFETRLGQSIVIPPGEELPPALRAAYSAEGKHSRRARIAELDGAVVDVELTRFPSGGVVPAGRVVEVLGRPGELGVDTEIVIRKHHIPHRFSEDVLAEAEATPQQVRDADLAGREDFRALPIVTIDGETARDFDDAVHVRRLPGDSYQLQVHIADVAHYVRPGSPLDREARVRGTSVYFPSRAVPMLPEALSNGICSLHPQVDRLVMSALLEIDRRGAVLRSRFTAGVIISLGAGFWYVVFGYEETKRRLPWLKSAPLIVGGILLATAGSTAPALLGGSFFAPVDFGALLGLPLPQGFYLSTSFLFEVAICLAVLGGASFMLDTLGHPGDEIQEAEGRGDGAKDGQPKIRHRKSNITT